MVKGAEPSNALAFLIASTTLVIELGINGLTSLWFPYGLAEQAKRHAERAQQREGMEAVSTRARHCQLVEALAKVSRRPRRRVG